MTGTNPIVVSLEPNDLADVWKDIRRVGVALSDPVQADRLVEQLQDRIGGIIDACHRIASRPSIACIEWIEPLMAAGNWMPELVEMAGGTNLFGEAGKHSPWMTFEQLIDKDPDVIVVSPCGFDIARTLQEMNLLSGKSNWNSISAVRNQRVYVADGNAFFNRPGPRLVESLEILAEILHPDSLRYGHRDVGWVRYR